MPVTPNIAPFINDTFWVTSPFWEVRGSRHHHGIDIAVPYNSDNDGFVYVYSMVNGECIETGYSDGYGNYTIIKQDGTNIGFLYAHLRIPDPQRLVEEGDIVTIGMAIGYEGSTGQSTGPHLHLEIQQLYGTNYNWRHADNIDNFINPATYMGIPNVTGTECYYNGTPYYPPVRRTESSFPWVLYARKFRDRGR